MKSYEKMVAVNRQTSERKELIAIEAMRKKYESQEQVSVVALVKETGLSRGFFYKNERVRTELSACKNYKLEWILLQREKLSLIKQLFCE